MTYKIITDRYGRERPLFRRGKYTTIEQLRKLYTSGGWDDLLELKEDGIYDEHGIIAEVES